MVGGVTPINALPATAGPANVGPSHTRAENNFHPRGRLGATLLSDVLSPVRDPDRDEPASPRPQLVHAAEPQPAPEPVDPDLAVDPGQQRAAEVALMRAVAAREPEAEAELVRRIVGPVRARARLLTRNPADADDAAQNALVEILRSAPGYRGEGSLAGWCERITVRTTLRLQRRQDRKHGLIDAAIDPDHVGEAGAEANLPNLREAIPGGAVEGYLAELSPDRHQALILRHVLGHSVDEIAEETGVSPNTVKDRLRMARRQVRQAIRQREVVAAIKRRLS